MAKQKKPSENPCFRPCVDLYFEFCKDTLKQPAKFDAGDGKAMKEIIKWIGDAILMAGKVDPITESESALSGQEQQIVDAWGTILKKHDSWGFDKGKAIRIKQINSRLTNIVQAIKTGVSIKGNNTMSLDEMAELNQLMKP